mmetsp:Transcript_22081/g.40572  ORF Transcript_22081/g.40572 Transcript_22081/m.40572 type:complete len:353 (-) Transcript_22081:36-1094(-)
MGRLTRYQYIDQADAHQAETSPAPYLRALLDIHGESSECASSTTVRQLSNRFLICRRLWYVLNGLGLLLQALRVPFAVLAWLAYSAYVLFLPSLANWANDKWHDLKPHYSYGLDGLCTTPAANFECSDGQNFTELVLARRGVPIGCGCGEGIFGEAICPFAPWGYTLSDMMTTAVGIGTLGALSIVPISLMWQYVDVVNVHFKPMPFFAALNWWSMALFQFFYIVWMIASNCIFPRIHTAAVYAWVICYFIHCTALGLICSLQDRAGQIVVGMAVSSLLVMIIGLIPELFTSLNSGLGSYIFVTAEGISMTGAFGITPVVMLFGGSKCDVLKDTSTSQRTSRDAHQMAPEGF